jgi:hypothetical protein
MDLFFDCVQLHRKRRVHFHEFMIEVHERLRVERAKEKGDPIAPVVAALAEEAKLLAFDEMVVNNTADAMILSRLFTGLMPAWWSSPPRIARRATSTRMGSTASISCPSSRSSSSGWTCSR